MLLVHNLHHHCHLGGCHRRLALLEEFHFHHGRSFFGWDPRLQHESKCSWVGFRGVESDESTVYVEFNPRPVSFGLDLRGDLVLQERRN